MAQGFILEVSITRVGTELDTDVLAGATTLPVIDVTVFTDLETGAVDVDQIDLGDMVLAVTGVDTAAGTVEVLLGPDTDRDAGTGVYPLPPVLEKWAMVEVNGEDEPISALVGGDLYDRLTDGVRDPEEQEPVVVEMQNGDWTVVNIIGEEPTIDGSAIDPTTAPVSPDLQAAIDEMREDITTQSGQLGDILGDPDLGTEGRLQNVEETATSARNLANTADGRVSMSDYQPAAEDVTYIATDKDGNPILDADGLPVLLQRNEGSIWFQRTRSRVNLVTNPSFETNLTGWVTTNLTVLRETHPGAPAGSYVATLTNDAGASHYFTDNNGGARYAVQAGLSYTWSIFAEAVSGTNTGVFARLDFYDAAGASVGTVAGTPVDLIVNDWTELGGSRRPYVTAVAPAGAVTVLCRIFNNNPSAVWRVDGSLLEGGDILGSYFDGTLYDCRWNEDGLGTAHASQSFMTGGKILTVWELDDGGWVQKFFMGDTLVDINAASITRGEMDGIHIVDGSIPQDKMSASPATASEALTAGYLVNLWSDNGVIKCRPAKANPGYEAHGFVMVDVPAGGLAYVYSHGYNPFATPTSMAPGVRFLSTTPGRSAPVAPKVSGQIVQRVGVAVNTVVMNFTPGIPIEIS